MNRQHPYLQKINLLFTSINQVNPYYLVLLVLCGHFLSFAPHTNEEAYFPLAKHFIDPSWMTGSFVFGEWPGTRLLYQYIAGFFLKYMSFESLSFWSRLVIFIASAFPLTKLFKHFNFSNITLLIILELFLIHQSWIGGEYIFGGFETKSLAYIFILFSLVSLFKKHYWYFIILSVAGSYFHVLVGIWYTLFALTYILIYERSVVLPVKLGISYSILLSPFIYFLSLHILGGSNIIEGVNIDWVYSYYRNPHHCVPFSRSVWPRVVLPSLIQIIISSILLFTLLRKKRSQQSDQFFWMMVVIFFMLWAAIIISLLDTTGSITKYYLFRINSIGALIFYIYVFWWIKRFYPVLARKAGYFLFFLFLIPVFIGKTTSNIKNNYLQKADSEYIEMIDFIKTNTNGDDILIEHAKLPTSFMRTVERESFVVRKLVPGGGEKIYEWYIRMEMLKSFRNNFNEIDSICTKYKIDYIITKKAFNQAGLTCVFQNDKYNVYQIDNNKQ
ncbi:hypothetical protein [Carboxylicivirga sp. M1479]|uniref:hypothetical protein n=1 Tax=Carboxylicivirga sp. M1479 TaxID=2594476 RepID=UPI001177A055|nr:hypothetical protein [Carboxylicivirga sp. M1479]TRX66229.1 hypothetical protein FNN09_14435 [Carboxylicivirga sp. M1479]